MKLKVFRLENAKLEYVGIREVRDGDAILCGTTAMTEVSLVEASTSDFPGLFGSGPTREEERRAKEKERRAAELKADLAATKVAGASARAKREKEELRAAFKRLIPGATEKELDIMVRGR